ncbi:MAG: response regulator [Deltaproteobacteria bacterium]|nr:response regulator [Deltaproteobacteria bacterium]
MASDGSKTVLVVEDEEALLRLSMRILEQAGFETLGAVDGDAALAAVAEHGDGIAAVLIDVGISPMGAEELLGQILTPSFQPGIVLTSGAACSPEMLSFLEARGGKFLPKPFSPADLKHAFQNGLA